jgi:hypothetical protein
MDSQTLELLRSSVHSLLAGKPGCIADALEELGWSEVLEDDAAAATSVLFREQGELGVSTAALDGVAAAALGLAPATRVLWPWPSAGSDPAVLGLALAPVPPDVPLICPVGDGFATVDVAAAKQSSVSGIAPESQWCRVEGYRTGPVSGGDWGKAVTDARLALASELTGVGRHVLEIARGHVSSRVQFGRPIGSFQAVRHRIASAYAVLAGAEAVTAAAWDDRSPAAAATAKSAAAAAHQEIASAALQVCGGMGLSAEHPLPAAVRRGMLLDALLGNAGRLARGHGELLLRGERVLPVGQF